jgi:DNA repair protein RadC
LGLFQSRSPLALFQFSEAKLPLATTTETWLLRDVMQLIREVKVCTVRETTPVRKADTPQACARFWRGTIATAPWFDPCKEHLVALLLDVRYRLVSYNLVSIGNLNESTAHPREILRAAIVAPAYAFVLAHNHPSGDPTPSRADWRLTHLIAKASAIVGIKFLDHIIVGRSNRYFSFEEVDWKRRIKTNRLPA